MSLTRFALCLPLAAGLLAFPVHAELLDEGQLADVIRKPSIGLYKGYAEFKMAHYPEARQIWTALAERGNAEAWYNLGILAEDGLGQAKDMAEALGRYRKAAEAGSSNAALRLGTLYQSNRLGGKSDLAAARHWLKVAADLGDEDAAAELLVLDKGPANLEATPDGRLAAARRLEAEAKLPEAVAAYRAIADAGDARGLTRLAWLHEAGKGVPRDLDEAARLFRQAAEAGEPEAQYALSVMLETGAGQPRDPQAARRWLEASAKAGYPPALAALKERQAP